MAKTLITILIGILGSIEYLSLLYLKWKILKIFQYVLIICVDHTYDDYHEDFEAEKRPEKVASSTPSTKRDKHATCKRLRAL